MTKRVLVGTVISDKMDKTVVAETERVYRHPRFHKVIRQRRKYKIHDDQEQAKVGDVIEFFEGRPISKTKYMYLARIVRPS